MLATIYGLNKRLTKLQCDTFDDKYSVGNDTKKTSPKETFTSFIEFEKSGRFNKEIISITI